MKQLLEVEHILSEAGITINGKEAWDVKVNNPKFLERLISEQSIGAGESYMDGWWDCDRLDELFFRLTRAHLERKLNAKWKLYYLWLKATVINYQSRTKADEVARTHYDIDNRFYELMLGKSMAYTCGYWKDAQTLDDAEFAKYDLCCRKLQLKPGDKVLELGCGWGGLAKYMAEKYQCEVVAIDIGTGPSTYAKVHCQDLPVTIYQCDYRDTAIYNPNGFKFDKIVSVGVLEHIGYKNYDEFLQIVKTFLNKDGLALIHSIGGNLTVKFCDPWIDKYIFPNGMLPSMPQFTKALEGKFIIEDHQNFGAYYVKTLLGWHKNFNDHWEELSQTHDERFRRMINYYLLSCAGSFRARSMQLWQFVLSHQGIVNGYQSIR